MNNKYDIEMGIDSFPSRKVRGRYDDEHVLVDVPLNTEEKTMPTWKNKLQNMHKYLVKGTVLSSEYTPVNFKIKKPDPNPHASPRASKCDNCIIS